LVKAGGGGSSPSSISIPSKTSALHGWEAPDQTERFKSIIELKKVLSMVFFVHRCGVSR
jgi:hypothetical protein